MRDPKLIKQIAVKDFDHFVNHRKFVTEDIVDKLWNRNLVSLRGIYLQKKIYIYWIGEKEMSYFVNRWRHLNISCVVLIASGQTIRLLEDDNLCYKYLFDSVVIVRFSLKL